MTLVSEHQWEKVAFLIIDIVIIIIMHSHSRVKNVSLSVLIYHISSKLFFGCWSWSWTLSWRLCGEIVVRSRL